jgi:hypothetical protein
MNDLQEFNVKMTTIEVERESIEDLHRRIEELECVTAGIWATLQEKDYFAAAELARIGRPGITKRSCPGSLPGLAKKGSLSNDLRRHHNHQ